MLDEARASQLQRTGARALQVWSCLNAPQRVLSFLPCHLAQEHNMGWKCMETAYYSDCPLPCAHGPGQAGAFRILPIIFSYVQLAALKVVESLLFLSGFRKLARLAAWLFVNAQLLGARHSCAFRKPTDPGGICVSPNCLQPAGPCSQLSSRFL